MQRSIVLALAVTFLLVTNGTAHADLIYSFAFDQANYTVAPGGTVDVKLFLREEVTGGSSSFLQDTGLIGAGILVNFADAAPTQPAQVLSTADIFPSIPPGGPFDGNSFILFTPGVSAGFTESVDIASPPIVAIGGGPVFDIYLGSLRFTAGIVPGEVTHIQALRTAPDSQDNVGADFPPTVLDDQINPGSATITVSASAVPEPSTWLLLSSAAASLLGYQWRRRKIVSSFPLV